MAYYVGRKASNNDKKPLDARQERTMKEIHKTRPEY